MAHPHATDTASLAETDKLHRRSAYFGNWYVGLWVWAGVLFSTQVNAARKEKEFVQYRSKVNELTNMLCALGGEIEKLDNKILTHKFPDIGNWYYIHRQADKRREEQEKREREQAILHKKRQMEELAQEIAALEESK